MIVLCTGTPGSGKSYVTVQNILANLKRGKLVISNIKLNLTGTKYEKYIDNYKYFTYDDDYKINVSDVETYIKEYNSNHKKKEGNIKLYIDECQLYFNSRNWQQNFGFVHLFSISRHLGLDCYLITQYDQMIDKQIRCLVEFENQHRKLSNYGWFFYFFPHLHYECQVWYNLKIKTQGHFFFVRKSIYKYYDTYEEF